MSSHDIKSAERPAPDPVLTAIADYADGRVIPGDLAQVVVGLDQAVDALSGRIDPAPGVKIHIDPRL